MSAKKIIADARERMRMSEKDFADLLGVSRGTIQQWESGKTAPNRTNRPRIAKLLDVQPTDLIGEDEPGIAHPLRPTPFTVPSETVWGDLMKMKKLPASFTAPMPDDSMSGSIRKGTVLYFETVGTGVDPVPGHGVLVADRAGEWHVRKFKRGIGAVWSAEASDDNYPSFESAKDGVLLLAVVKGIMSGKL